MIAKFYQNKKNCYLKMLTNKNVNNHLIYVFCGLDCVCFCVVCDEFCW